MSRFKNLPTPALVLSMIALFVAFSGNGYAARSTSSTHSITSIHVKDRSLLAKDFKSGQIPRGPAGAPGLQVLPAPPVRPARPVRRRRMPACSPAATSTTRARAGSPTPASRTRAAGMYCIDIEGGAVNIFATIDSAGAPGEFRGRPAQQLPVGQGSRDPHRGQGRHAADRAFYVLVN